MTAPGPIQPIAPAQTQPLYFAQTPGLSQQIAPSLRLLLDAIQQQKAQQAATQQQGMDSQTGALLGQLLPALAQQTNPGGTVPAAPGTGMITPVAVPPSNTVAQRMSTVFKGRPGEVILGAAKTANNQIGAAMTAEQNVLKPEVSHYVTDTNGQLVGVKTDGSGQPVTYRGTSVPVKVKDIVTDKGTVYDTHTNDKTGKPIFVWSKTGETVDNKDLAAAARVVPSRAAGPAGGGVEASKALGLYTAGMQAYHSTKDMQPLHTNLADMYGTLSLIGGPEVMGTPETIRRWYAQTGMNANDRNRIEMTIPLVQAIGHNFYGSRLPMGTALLIMQAMIPWENDAAATLDGKNRFVQSGLMGIHEKAMPAVIATEQRTGKHIVDPYNDLHWDVGSALDPSAWGLPTPGDPVSPLDGKPLDAINNRILQKARRAQQGTVSP